MTLILKVAKSKKGNDYVCLGTYNEQGWFVALTFDPSVICKALSISMKELYLHDLGEYKF